MAEYLSLSESYLSKLFLKEMGIPLSHYITDLKIEKAKNLCRNIQITALSKSPIISLFASQSHFIQVFQKKTGITPYKYRIMYFRTNWEAPKKS